MLRPGVLNGPLAMLAAGVMVLGACACESTEQESAKIAREGASADASSQQQQLGGGLNRSVHASEVTFVSGGGRHAVAARLTSTSHSAERDVPVLAEVLGPHAKVVFSSATSGGEALLGRIARLPPHASEWWVDDEILATGATSGVRVRVGTGRRAGAGGALSASKTGVSQASGTSTLSGVLVNHTGRAQRSVPVYAVAVRGGKVVAAGRVVVSALPARDGGSAPFQISMVGAVSGAKIELTALPTQA